MLFVRELQVNIGILCTEGIEQPVHHVPDLGLADVVALVVQAPGQCQEPQSRKLSEHEDDLGEIHDTLSDREGN